MKTSPDQKPEHQRPGSEAAPSAHGVASRTLSADDALVEKVAQAIMRAEFIREEANCGPWKPAARAAIQAVQEAQWRPIKTAPLDRDIIVTGFIYNDPKRGRWAQVARWNGREFATEQAPLFPPTYWMPLPSFPKEGDNKAPLGAAPAQIEEGA